MDDNPFFSGVRRWPWPLAGGLEVPLFFPSLGFASALYTADTVSARRLLPDARMRPVEVMPGRCLFSITGLHYRESDLGPYDELSLAVPIAFGSHPLPALDALWKGVTRVLNAFVWQLPVTTQRACDAGVELAGFPKFVADIVFERDEQRLRFRLSEQGQAVMTLVVDAPDDPGERELKLRGYTMQDGVPLVSNLLLRQTRFRDHLQRDAARLELGSGALAESLRALRLSDRPVGSHVCSQARAMLFFPRNVMDD
jgi:hypothetical protein